ncbi:hypothetical protein Hypma_004692, partial [Hypsizygus marmoreus]
MPRRPSSNTDLDRKILWMYTLENYRKNLATLPPKVQEQYRSNAVRLLLGIELMPISTSMATKHS